MKADISKRRSASAGYFGRTRSSSSNRAQHSRDWSCFRKPPLKIVEDRRLLTMCVPATPPMFWPQTSVNRSLCSKRFRMRTPSSRTDPPPPASDHGAAEHAGTGERVATADWRLGACEHINVCRSSFNSSSLVLA